MFPNGPYLLRRSVRGRHGVQLSLGTTPAQRNIPLARFRWPDALTMRRWMLAGRLRLV